LKTELLSFMANLQGIHDVCERCFSIKFPKAYNDLMKLRRIKKSGVNSDDGTRI
jgi:hypothetical protein